MGLSLPGHESQERTVAKGISFGHGHGVLNRKGTCTLCSLAVLGIFHQFLSQPESVLEFGRLNRAAMSRNYCRCRHDPF